MLSRDGQNTIHVRRIALKMDCQDELGLRSNMPLDVIGVDVERLVDFGKDRQGARQDDRVEAGVPGPGGQDHLVAGADAESGHGSLEGGSPGSYSQSVAG